MTNDTKTPSAIIREGALKATIWKNNGPHGDFYKVTVTRTFKQGDDFKETGSLTGAENLQASRLRLQAYERTLELEAADREAAESEQTT